MSVNAETVVYAILDLLSQAVFGYWLIVSHDSMDVL
jgi:bacteriorhodopsin